jgi:hypothetical protein
MLRADSCRTNSELEDLKARMAQMERLLSTSAQGQGGGSTDKRFSPSSSRESSGTTDDRSGSSATPALLARPIRPLPRSSQLSLNVGQGDGSGDEAEAEADAEPKRGEKASASSPQMADSNHFDRLKVSRPRPPSSSCSMLSEVRLVQHDSNANTSPSVPTMDHSCTSDPPLSGDMILDHAASPPRTHLTPTSFRVSTSTGLGTCLEASTCLGRCTTRQYSTLRHSTLRGAG